jgi:nitronate monooxygenase
LNHFVKRWHGREGALAEPPTNAEEKERYWNAFHSGDADNAGVMIGEAVGTIREVVAARIILEDMVLRAERLLSEGPRRIATVRK